jgi:hypothetical protein
MASTYGILSRLQNLRGQAACFRELDVSVYSILRSYEPGSRSGRVTLHTETTVALLQDMWSKADHVLTGHRKAFGFGAKVQDASANSRDATWSDPFKFLKGLQRLWPSICELFEHSARQIGATEETMDVDMESLLGDSPHSEILSTIIAIFNKFFSCPDLEGAKGDEALLPILKVSPKFAEILVPLPAGFSGVHSRLFAVLFKRGQHGPRRDGRGRSLRRDGPFGSKRLQNARSSHPPGTLGAPCMCPAVELTPSYFSESIAKELPTFELCSSMVTLLSNIADRGRESSQDPQPRL